MKKNLGMSRFKARVAFSDERRGEMFFDSRFTIRPDEQRPNALRFVRGYDAADPRPLLSSVRPGETLNIQFEQAFRGRTVPRGLREFPRLKVTGIDPDLGGFTYEEEKSAAPSPSAFTEPVKLPRDEIVTRNESLRERFNRMHGPMTALMQHIGFKGIKATVNGVRVSGASTAPYLMLKGGDPASRLSVGRLLVKKLTTSGYAAQARPFYGNSVIVNVSNRPKTVRVKASRGKKSYVRAKAKK